jgi:hypothetical protein
MLVQKFKFQKYVKTSNNNFHSLSSKKRPNLKTPTISKLSLPLHSFSSFLTAKKISFPYKKKDEEK